MQNDIISIIVPIYKVENYLNKCVESLVNQTYKNLEIILVDDGSPDNCPKICDEWALKDSRIKVIHKENGGVSVARNVGLDIAKGNFIGFVDSDDYIHSTMYEKLYNSIKTNQSDMAMCCYSMVFDDNSEQKLEESNLNKVIGINALEYSAVCNYEKHENSLHIDAITLSIWRMLYKKDVIGDCRFDTDIGYGEDFLFNTNLLNNNTRISIVNESLYYYYQRVNAATHCFNEKMIITKLKYIDKIKEAIKYKVAPQYYNAFKFNWFKMVYLDFIRSGNTSYYKQYYKTLKDKSLNTKLSYKSYNKLTKSLKDKIVNFLTHHNMYTLLRLLYKVKNK